jgi:hypothetical protein
MSNQLSQAHGTLEKFFIILNFIHINFLNNMLGIKLIVSCKNKMIINTLSGSKYKQKVTFNL